jgi:hypothetical protein
VTRAALRVADQRRGRLPDRCVKRGTRTDGAVHAWAVEMPRADVLWAAFGPLLRVVARGRGRQSLRVVLPLSPAAWSSLRAGLRWAVVVTGLGAGALVLGLLRGDVALEVLGGTLLAAAWALRAVVLWRRWVGLVVRPGGEEVAVTRVSAEFAEAARDLFVGSVLRRPRR